MSSRRGGRSSDRRKGLPRGVQISKLLSKLLRHDAEKEKLFLDPGGYANVNDVLNNHKFRSQKVTFDEIRAVVEDNDKQRFTMILASQQRRQQPNSILHDTDREDHIEKVAQPSVPSSDPRDFLIRANQGHSVYIEAESLLTPVTFENLPTTAVHGTTHKAWPLILASGGLKPMTRNHVHFACGLPKGFKSIVEDDASLDAEQAAPVISGMRNSSTVLIFMDVTKAMEAGIKLWLSDNQVILSEGNENGLVPLEVFKRVEDRTGVGVLVEAGKVIKEAPTIWSSKG